MPSKRRRSSGGKMTEVLNPILKAFILSLGNRPRCSKRGYTLAFFTPCIDRRLSLRVLIPTRRHPFVVRRSLPGCRRRHGDVIHIPSDSRCSVVSLSDNPRMSSHQPNDCRPWRVPVLSPSTKNAVSSRTHFFPPTTLTSHRPLPVISDSTQRLRMSAPRTSCLRQTS